MKKSHILGAVCTFLFVVVSSSVKAVPLNLTLSGFPDIVSSLYEVSYAAGTDSFSATGFALELDDDGSVPAEAITDGSFSISATIDDVGSLSGGSLNIGGTVASLGFNSGTLLTGSLTAFGFPDAGGDPLEFLFDVTGGDAAGLFGGAPVGIILSATGFGGSWASDFSTSFTSSADVGTVTDVATVPAPPVLWLIGLGLIGVFSFGRQSRRRQSL